MGTFAKLTIFLKPEQASLPTCSLTNRSIISKPNPQFQSVPEFQPVWQAVPKEYYES